MLLLIKGPPKVSVSLAFAIIPLQVRPAPTHRLFAACILSFLCSNYLVSRISYKAYESSHSTQSCSCSSHRCLLARCALYTSSLLPSLFPFICHLSRLCHYKTPHCTLFSPECLAMGTKATRVLLGGTEVTKIKMIRVRIYVPGLSFKVTLCTVSLLYLAETRRGERLPTLVVGRSYNRARLDSHLAPLHPAGIYARRGFVTPTALWWCRYLIHASVASSSAMYLSGVGLRKTILAMYLIHSWCLLESFYEIANGSPCREYVYVLRKVSMRLR